MNLSERNSQKFFYKLILFLLIVNFQFLYSNEISEIKFKEDIEIINLENEIKLLEQKVKNLKLQKSNKRKEDIKIGLALSGGGAKGYAHLGVLKILEKENIKIDYITGTSIGALIGTLYSIGYEINKIEEILDRLNLDNFWRTGSNIGDLSIEKKESLKKYSL
ncbi:MAG: patatin-like phospholipase family protein, partial [Fusobacterium sp.]|nr:patatin-like phospholipase family protein [Fusobacterium sp.]